jgi:hypothetical protein
MMTAIHSAAKTISQSISPAATRLEKPANAERSADPRGDHLSVGGQRQAVVAR